MVEAVATQRVIILKVSGKNLADLDTFSKSDPVCTLHKYGQDAVVSQTEMILNDLNPEFQQNLQIMVDESNLEERLIFRMHDDDAVRGQSEDFSNCDLIGEAYCTVNSLIHRAQQPENFRTWTCELKCPSNPNRKNGQIIIEPKIVSRQA